FIIRNMGVNAAVSGSYLFNEGQVGKALLNLKNTETASHYLVKDFMRKGDEIPILNPVQRSFKDVLLSIENHNLGFTILTDDKGKLEGLISNADVRRGLIKNIDDIAKTSINDMINTKPVKVSENDTVADLLKTIKSKSFPISFLPVVNDANEVCGVITFFNLVKGEL
ncbi:MAG: CBS domain-containing protein, partial [Bacteroidota bacterium]